MATIRKLKSKTGTISYVAQVRVRPFDPCQQTFRVTTNATTARKSAIDWAKAEEARLRRKRTKGGNAVPKDITHLTIGNLITAYLDDFTVKQLRSYKDIDRLLTWWTKSYVWMRIMDFDDQTIRDARKKLEEEKSTPATVNRYVSQMRRVWHWGTPAFVPRDQAWPDNLMMTEPAGRSVFLDDAQLAALLKAAAPNKVMHAAILLSVGTGIRQGELLRLQWKDVDLDGGKITLLVTKNNTPRTVHVPSTVVAAMRGLRKVKKMVPTASVFLVKKGMPLKVSTLEARWRKIRAAAGLANFRWHDLRHSCASFLARRGASLLEIASVLGHKSPSMVMRYAHLTQGQPVKGHTELDALLSGKAAT